MSELTLLEHAAEVRERHAALEKKCQEIKNLKGDWISYSVAAKEAKKVAEDGLCNAWTILGRLNQLAASEMARMIGNKTHD